MVNLNSDQLSLNDINRAVNSIESAVYVRNTPLDKYERCKALLDIYVQNNLSNIVQTLNTNFKTYIQSAGISPTTDTTQDANYTNAKNSYSNIFLLQKTYDLLNSKLSALLRQSTNNQDAQAKLQRIGQLQQEIANLKKDIETAKSDLDVAQSRQATLEDPNSKVSYYQGFAGYFGFTKPLHKWSIPILLSFGILSLILSAILLRELGGSAIGIATKQAIQTASEKVGVSTSSEFYSYNTNENDSVFKKSLLFGAGISFIGFIGLAFYGYLGKSD